MSVEKRNALASLASQYVPSAIEELRTAEQNIRDNKPHEALKWIAEAQRHLDDLKVAFVGACAERAAEEGGHLGED
jgi:hypothetical protein